MTKRRLRILHLSDLHIGKERPENAYRVERVMGEAWDRNLTEIRKDGEIDLVCFTGDLAQSGRADQYHRLKDVIRNVQARVECPLQRFFCVPGNHDIDREIEKSTWRKFRPALANAPHAFSDWFAENPPPVPPATGRKKTKSRAPAGFRDAARDALLARQRAYRDFLVDTGLAHLLPGQAGNPHPRLGYRHTLDLGLGAPLHIIGFDSAWLAGDDNDASKLHLTEDQIGRLMTHEGKRLSGWSIGLIHHPPGDLADGDRAKQLMADYGLGLLLHGHQHTGKIESWADPQRRLSVFAAGCLYESQNYPNGLSLIEIELPEHAPLRPVRVQTRAWSANGHWHNHDGLYRDSRNGWLVLDPEPVVAFASTPGRCVGRESELRQLCKALLPEDSGAGAQPTVICCAIDGMPGVGKTRLAEEFITEHWLQAYPPPPDTPAGECVLRLVLVSGEDQAVVRTADAMLRDLADRLNVRGSIEDVRRDLPSALRHGPGGHPRLVLIENVDSDAQAVQVAALVHGLPGCPVLVTARVRKFGGQAWKRVDLAPLLLADAIELLREEAAAAGEDACVPTEAQAQHLAETLGRLPLALHIAASHLGLGKTPQEFLDELRATGLDLAPAQYGDHSLQVDRARAILRSSFDISWQAWCAGAGNRNEWQQALVALAHGPAEGVGESLGAAMTDLSQDQYGPCIVAASRLSLLEWEWSGKGETRERRVRLHALIAEFLRTLPQPEAAAVVARMGAWFAPRVSDGNQDTMGKARREVRSEPGGLLRWLGETRLEEAALSIVDATHYASASGPYGAWLACLKAAMPEAGETQRGLDLAWAVASLAVRSGDPEYALHTARQFAVQAKQQQKDREYAVALGQISNILQARGELEEALRIRREEELPVYERLGDVRSCAITQGQIAGILQLRGELEEALRIRREEELPVYERLGDVHAYAVTQSEIAGILKARDEVEEALLICREEVLPVFERLGDVRWYAITQGKIADILLMRGGLEEALCICCEQVLPVFERFGEFSLYASTLEKIAFLLQIKGDLEEALRIRREEVIPMFERLGDVVSLVKVRANLAMNLLLLGRHEDAAEVGSLLEQVWTDAQGLSLSEMHEIRMEIAFLFSGVLSQ